MNKNVGTVCVHGKKQRRNVDNTGAEAFLYINLRLLFTQHLENQQV